ncbi:lipopolysaccharide transport periplasmic protein LptA [Thauera sp. CAU 1555]|uniref:Lipopolysaccharide export system protein LptA n=1 Tax=Thauera sedimentorum TaxID=2767595 RepID=A0ABR9BE78_9RHOO|nr:lipopolysaccharide transport periplasmic protein LptA [Thauera sedimentorum]MBC9073557.1 lipopolysaccharide transport periplasmic protein LptA [Thauera sedimentorum]MBD8504476.1 lipopolysaccharide transport periplasmic protein LptA [Thauera sedimentorum]
MKRILATTLLSLAAATSPALAERADREQPVNIEADHVTVDDRNKTHVFEGKVVLSQGTLQIRGDRLVVTQGADGFQTGVATGTDGRLATFRQRREGTNDYVEGEAERIEYDSRTERAKLFVRAYVKSGGDEVRGNYIEYDALSENYVVTTAPGSGGQASGGRVRAVIQPKGSAAPAEAPAAGR